jgi:hypothetical protein
MEMDNPKGIHVKPNDKVFYDSPDSGHPDCKCSRCGKPIPAKESPILRMWPTESGDHGYDPNAAGGTEFRYCWACCEAMGIKFSNPLNDDFYEDF